MTRTMTNTKEKATCPGCNEELDPSPRGRQKIYCSGRCRMRVSRRRLHQDLKELMREHIARPPGGGLGPKR